MGGTARKRERTSSKGTVNDAQGKMAKKVKKDEDLGANFNNSDRTKAKGNAVSKAKETKADITRASTRVRTKPRLKASATAAEVKATAKPKTKVSGAKAERKDAVAKRIVKAAAAKNMAKAAVVKQNTKVTGARNTVKDNVAKPNVKATAAKGKIKAALVKPKTKVTGAKKNRKETVAKPNVKVAATKTQAKKKYGTTGKKANKASSRVHPQQGCVPIHSLPEYEWYDLDVNKPFPEGPYVAARCSECGGKNRMDHGWRYCRDMQHAREQSMLTAMVVPRLCMAWGHLLTSLPELPVLKYECCCCRTDKPCKKDKN